jgi:phosphoribosylformylglycinamidine synthase
LIRSAHDCSDGGLFVALAESSIHSGKGFDISTDESIRSDAFLFGEGQSRVVVTVRPGDEDSFLHEMMERDVEFSLLGTVMGDEMTVDEEAFFKVNEAKDLFDNSLGNLLK